MHDEVKSPHEPLGGEVGDTEGGKNCTPLFRAFVAFLSLCIACVVIYGFFTYRKGYRLSFSGTNIAGINYVEISLVKEDIHALACASDRVIEGSYCAYDRNGQRRADTDLDETKIIRQYNTIRNELFMAVGLWAQPGMTGPLPDERFTVVCEFTPIGQMKNPQLRWSATGEFKPSTSSAVVGKLANCVIPR